MGTQRPVFRVSVLDAPPVILPVHLVPVMRVQGALQAYTNYPCGGFRISGRFLVPQRLSKSYHTEARGVYGSFAVLVALMGVYAVQAIKWLLCAPSLL